MLAGWDEQICVTDAYIVVKSNDEVAMPSLGRNGLLEQSFQTESSSDNYDQGRPAETRASALFNTHKASAPAQGRAGKGRGIRSSVGRV